MTHEQLRTVYTSMGFSQPRMAALLGVSTVTFKRFAVGERPVPTYIARSVLGLQLMQQNGLFDEFLALVETELTRKRAPRDITEEEKLARIAKARATMAANAAKRAGAEKPKKSKVRKSP